jgi:ferredoxin--NADP+ reductase
MAVGTRTKAAARVGAGQRLLQARLVSRQDITPELMVIKLQPEGPFSFKPGQYCTIGLEGIERAYSIVSAPHEPLLELFVELVPEGELTPLLWKLPLGGSVTLRPRAKGLFTMDEGYPNQLMVATVTGIAPYLSILRSYLHEGRSGHRFYVLHGASYQDELTYDRELQELAERYPETVTYIPTVSRPHEERNAGWQGETGRVNLIVEKYLCRFGLGPAETVVYACGHPGMIEDVKRRLRPQGFIVKEERFWKA